MERLVAVVQDLSRARSLTAVQSIVRKSARELMRADGASFVLRDQEQCHYLDEDAIAPLWKGQRFPMDACVSGWSMLNGVPAVIPDVFADARVPVDAYRTTFVRSLVMVPVRSWDPIAAIGVYWAAQHTPHMAEVKLLQALADSTSVALENVSLYTELQTRVAEREAALESARRTSEELRNELAERQRAQAALESTESQLRQSQKMDALGQLAGGVAHDFNNILTVILSCSSTAALELPVGSPVREDMEEIRRAAKRASALTSRLLAFTRQEVSSPKVVNLGEVSRSMELMLRRLIGAHMELEFFVPDGLAPVFADVNQMEQVVLNLVINARDAMPNGGKLTVEMANVHLRAGHSAQPHIDEGDYVMLAVSDTGVGMDRATQLHIFEPFFTTKEAGKGTGLGLSTVQNIVKQNHGHILVYSEPGEGSTFKVYFPRCNQVGATRRVEAVNGDALCGTESVLLVEDDEQVRAVVRGILRRNGYRVTEAATPKQALAEIERGNAFELLLTDTIMPQMSGFQLIELVRERCPGVRAVCMSGYPGEAALRSGLIADRVSFLPKPLTPDSLLSKVRQVLDSAA